MKLKHEHTGSEYVNIPYSYPNNPNGVRRNPLVKNANHVIRDMVYYWPMYTDVNITVSEPIMIFSRFVLHCCLIISEYLALPMPIIFCSSKHEGLAGTRFGWGFYEDLSLAQTVAQVVDIFTLGLSIDVELRVLASIQAILGT